MEMVRTALVGTFLALYILLAGPPMILYCLLGGSAERLYRVGLAGAKAALRLAGVRVRAEGLENIPAGACIFVGNHTSNVDPMAVAEVIPRRVALLAKKEVFRVPILARAMRLCSMVPVDRSNRQAARRSAEEAGEHLRRGISFLIFPEGTRSPDGRLGVFKKGTFIMAIHERVPIVPVSVVGAQHIMRKGSLALRPGEVSVRFHPPIDASACHPGQKGELIARVRAAVAAGLPEDQQPAPSEERVAKDE